MTRRPPSIALSSASLAIRPPNGGTYGAPHRDQRERCAEPSTSQLRLAGCPPVLLCRALSDPPTQPRCRRISLAGLFHQPSLITCTGLRLRCPGRRASSS